MLTEQDRARLRKAVGDAESGLAAEIVPCVFRQSSHYPEAVWAAGAAAAALACAALFLQDVIRPLWAPVSLQILAVPAAGLVGAALGRWCSRTKRFFVGAQHMEEAVARRAKEVFFDRGVWQTKSRDGVLIYLSLLERRAVVLADEAVRVKVAPDDWLPVIAAAAEHAADGRVADGLAAAIARAGEILRAAGFASNAAAHELGEETVEGRE